MAWPFSVALPVPFVTTVRSRLLAVRGVVKVASCFLPKSPVTLTASLSLPGL